MHSLIAQTQQLAFIAWGSLLQHYFTKINWDGVVSTVMQALFNIIGLSLLFFIINYVGKKIIKKMFTADFGKYQTMTSGRLQTTFTLVKNIFHYTVLFFYLYAVLSILGVPVGTLIASAGIASVALGLGAQGFVTDVVTGFFILLEQQFDVGDSVTIANISGVVTAVGLRTTQVTSVDGTLHFIPNRNITLVSNQSRNDMRAVIDINLPPEADITAMKQVITQTNEQLATKYADDLTKPPLIFGTVTTTQGALALRMLAFTKNGAQLQIQADFLAAYLAALTKAGFTIPTSPLNLTEQTPTK